MLEFDYVPAPAFLRDRLWQAQDQPVQRAVRVRRQDGEPVMYLTSYVPGVLGRTFTADELNHIPMLQLLARAGAHISGGEKIVSATLADPLVAGRLEIKVGAPLLDLRSLMLDQEGRAVEYIETLAIPDRLKLRIEISADQLMPLPASAKPRRPGNTGNKGGTHVTGSKIPITPQQRQDDRGARRHRLHHRRV